ncbi:Hypothetical protein NGAL_HAMBI1145_09590 [Neorhizobium galegae bv. officinalis]|uniref:Uncharacterized protein n=1 Tax=Neorhizobium galegae bv. officinalis TaxID=323656 RepID=A0A0T7FAZ2_NEOGA|nr:hypothetical protein [Neorhizobium galegae]CDZ32188.1 Hypothetical protein NGAL_HAMBI1145_09590 [Neorhizobium galegae bv. officinalis]
MSFTWSDAAARIIDDVHRTLPADADLAARKRALREARPSCFLSTSWGRKVWQKAQRQYLQKFGLKPRGSAKLPLSPLEKLMQRNGDTK